VLFGGELTGNHVHVATGFLAVVLANGEKSDELAYLRSVNLGDIKHADGLIAFFVCHLEIDVWRIVASHSILAAQYDKFFIVCHFDDSFVSAKIRLSEHNTKCMCVFYDWVSVSSEIVVGATEN